eukprot:CAMPEP_0177753818 /NCGR_PEP_ID=MMETSP0491_2-20121128/1668_1 /TAXON_ID=63592 /ORGANISM="Tetraselmis chuii, Strain PLY429" /LENGTH=326 /DNA_ID=CAMNT_0019269139 /DNA_START=500 /DNA_END=1476 /DNA_ORIENTATION=-
MKLMQAGALAKEARGWDAVTTLFLGGGAAAGYVQHTCRTSCLEGEVGAARAAEKRASFGNTGVSNSHLVKRRAAGEACGPPTPGKKRRVVEVSANIFPDVTSRLSALDGVVARSSRAVGFAAVRNNKPEHSVRRMCSHSYTAGHPLFSEAIKIWARNRREGCKIGTQIEGSKRRKSSKMPRVAADKTVEDADMLPPPLPSLRTSSPGCDSIVGEYECQHLTSVCSETGRNDTARCEDRGLLLALTQVSSPMQNQQHYSQHGSLGSSFYRSCRSKEVSHWKKPIWRKVPSNCRQPSRMTSSPGFSSRVCYPTQSRGHRHSADPALSS